MPQLPMQGDHEWSTIEPVKPIVVLAIVRDQLRDWAAACLEADYQIYQLPLDDTPADHTLAIAASVWVVDAGVVLPDGAQVIQWLAAAGWSVPSIYLTDSEAATEWPDALPGPALILTTPCIDQQLTTAVATLERLATLERRAAQQEQVLDHFSESFIAVDARWQITWVNTATERALQVQRQHILGRNAWQMFPQAYTSPRAAIYRRAMEERVPTTIEGNSPAVGWFEIDAVPLYDGGVALYLRNATALKEAKAAMAASERRLRLFLEHARNYALAVLDLDGRVLEWLGGAETITGWTPEELLGQSIAVMFTPEDNTAGQLQAEMDTAARKGRAQDKRWHMRKGESRFFSDGLTIALRDEDGRLQGFGKVFRDATAEKLAEETLRQSQEQLRLIVHSVADGIFGMATDGSCTFLNPAAAAALGYSLEELIGRPFHEVIHHHRADGSFYPIEDCKIRQAIRQGITLRVKDEVFWRKDGSSFPVHYSVNPIVHEGVITGAVVAFTDVTEAQRAEAALRESERRLRFVLDFMPQKVFTATPSGAIDYFNPEWMTYTGLHYAEIRGWGWTQVIHAEDVDEKLRAWHDAIGRGSSYQHELRLRDARGEHRWHLARALPLRDNNGEVTMWIGTATDIHDVKKLEVKLSQELAAEKRNAALLSNLAEASHAINTVLSLDNIVQVLKERTQAILGIDHVDVQITARGGRQAGGVTLPSALSTGAAHLATPSQLQAKLIGHGERELGGITVWASGGRSFSAEDAAILAQLAALAAVGIENAFLYETLREQDRHKDEFLATLAHELRNPLAPLRTGLDLLMMSSLGDSGENIRNMMARQLAHMVRLVDDLMDVSRVSRGKVELKREQVSLRAIFETALEASGPQISACHHRLQVNVTDEPVCVHGDLTRLAQIISNLLNNAAKYTPEGGAITLQAELEDDEIVISVRDSGIGIPAEMLSRIFDLFTQVAPSTDRSHGGLGIGLALVQKLVEMHGGTVRAESAGIGKGSTFIVRLPAVASTEADLTSERPAEQAQAAKRILVVDDNVEAAETLGMLLQYTGHQVQLAHDGFEAIEAVAQYQPQVVLLDIGLPGMNGYEVAARLRAERPPRELVIIALTGWGGEDDRRRSREAGFDCHLTKPVDAKTLFGVLNRFFPSDALA